MFCQLTHPLVPASLRGALLVDDVQRLPRYWAGVWALMANHDLAASSQVKKLRYIENLYGHADRLFGRHSLDDALGCLNDAVLADILESWFISIRNQPSVGPADESRLRAGLEFVVSVVTWLSKITLPTERLRQIEARLHRLSNLYGQLHIRQSRHTSQVRSLPASVVQALYEVLDPSSATNPFPRTHTRWLAFVAFCHGRRYRAKHAALEKRGTKSISLWADMDDPNVPHTHFQKSFGQRRQQIVGDCLQLKTDVDVYNDKRQPASSIQMPLDFTLDVIELQQPLRNVA